MTSNAPANDLEYHFRSLDYWIDNYITKNHPEIGRVGPICPFVEPARKNNTLEVRARYVGSSPSLQLVEEIARSSIREYELTTWQGNNPMLRAMLVLFPDLSMNDAHLLDDAQCNVKDDFVANGLMIGQFHENCDTRAARNPGFAVSKGPVPLLAIRQIAIHDIFFLSDHQHWFEQYRDKFGRYFESNQGGVDATLADRYRKAANHYGYESPAT